jgi:hypothetical protein
MGESKRQDGKMTEIAAQMIWPHIRSAWLTTVIFVTGLGHAFGQSEPLVGTAAFGDWQSDKHKTREFAETRGDVFGR